MTRNRQWRLAAHPVGRALADGDLLLAEAALSAPGPGEMQLKTLYLGFDPAQKGWMENVADYVAPMAIGDVMRGSAILEVTASNGGRGRSLATVLTRPCARSGPTITGSVKCHSSSWKYPRGSGR